MNLFIIYFYNILKDWEMTNLKKIACFEGYYNNASLMSKIVLIYYCSYKYFF
jgi:hypothetical protein